jgi:hypothetical protein
VDWIGVAQDRNRWRALVNSVLNLRVPWHAGKLSSGLTSSGLSSSARRPFNLMVCFSWLAYYKEFLLGSNLIRILIKSKSISIPVTRLGGLQGCEMLRITHCITNRLRWR